MSEGVLQIEGRLPGASNATMRARIEGTDDRVVIKPVAGERPLWDFPDGTLSGREVAAYELSEFLGWDLIPLTIWRQESPVGEAMVQRWIDATPDARAIDVCRPQEVPEGWTVVLEAEDQWGQPVVLAHEQSPELAKLAVFDILVNNADRKGGHVLIDRTGQRWGIDHGVCFSHEPKLRTVLWGWIGEPISSGTMQDLLVLGEQLESGLDPVERWLHPAERRALRARVADLLHTGVFPAPANDWPAVPWPVM